MNTPNVTDTSCVPSNLPIIVPNAEEESCVIPGVTEARTIILSAGPRVLGTQDGKEVQTQGGVDIGLQ